MKATITKDAFFIEYDASGDEKAATFWDAPEYRNVDVLSVKLIGSDVDLLQALPEEASIALSAWASDLADDEDEANQRAKVDERIEARRAA